MTKEEKKKVNLRCIVNMSCLTYKTMLENRNDWMFNYIEFLEESVEKCVDITKRQFSITSASDERFIRSACERQRVRIQNEHEIRITSEETAYV